MRKEIEQLKQNKIQHEKLLTALISTDSSDSVLEQLRSGTEIERLDMVPTDLMRSSEVSRLKPNNENWTSVSSNDVWSEVSGLKLKTENWTTITSDLVWIDHLMALYFCWEYPIFAPLSKDHFLQDFKSGRKRYCSSLLVNAILAVGCRYSLQPKAREIIRESKTAGDLFFAEATHLLEAEENRHSYTTVQSLGLMSIRQSSCDQLEDSLFYSGQSIRLAVEMGLHNNVNPDQNSDAERIVRSATFWGAFSLDEAWSLSLERLPHFSENIMQLKKPDRFEHADTPWAPCTEENDLPCETKPRQMSNIKSVFLTFCGLSELVHESLCLLYSPVTEITKATLLGCYNNYLHWYDKIPENLQHGQDFTPAVLFLHIYYHFAILLLFRPFMKHQIIFSSVCPRSVCSQAADAIATLISSYSRLYSLSRSPAFLPYCTLTSTVTKVMILGNSESSLNFLSQGIANQKEMFSHTFPHRALDILRYSSKLLNLELAGNHDKREVETFKEEMKKNIVWKVPHQSYLNNLTHQDFHIPSLDKTKEYNPTPLDENPLFWSCPSYSRQPLRGFPDENIAKLGLIDKEFI